jgi:hypothetical protein
MTKRPATTGTWTTSTHAVPDEAETADGIAIRSAGRYLSLALPIKVKTSLYPLREEPSHE